MLFTLFGCGGGGRPKGAGPQLAYAVFHPLQLQLKNGNLPNRFLDILTILNYKISYVEHVLDPLYVFFTLFGCWRGADAAPKGLGCNLLMLFSTFCTSKREI